MCSAEDIAFHPLGVSSQGDQFTGIAAARRIIDAERASRTSVGAGAEQRRVQSGQPDEWERTHASIGTLLSRALH
jgi:hypothetical protein